ncbi:hypothetical protein M879_22840 [Mycobacteroides abscessus V06705]|nr:hypothetical protein M879_22840 [Mycobacteroides abscessus V06705]
MSQISCISMELAKLPSRSAIATVFPRLALQQCSANRASRFAAKASLPNKLVKRQPFMLKAAL